MGDGPITGGIGDFGPKFHSECPCRGVPWHLAFLAFRDGLQLGSLHRERLPRPIRSRPIGDPERFRPKGPVGHLPPNDNRSRRARGTGFHGQGQDRWSKIDQHPHFWTRRPLGPNPSCPIHRPHQKPIFSFSGGTDQKLTIGGPNTLVQLPLPPPVGRNIQLHFYGLLGGLLSGDQMKRDGKESLAGNDRLGEVFGSGPTCPGPHRHLGGPMAWFIRRPTPRWYTS
jgi:hypothetical protein